MANPIILVNSATGSDSAASGAGPATALTGSAGVCVGAVITLDGSPDLSGVAVDGSHVLYWADTGAGNRNFAKIFAKANSGTPTAQVTLSDLVTAGTKAWAIGGKRASIGSTTSKKLFDNNGSAGDATPGFTVQMESGHTETISSSFAMRRAGNTTDGPITLRGDPAAGTMPILTMSADAVCIDMISQSCQVRGFEIQNSNGSKTNASRGINMDSSALLVQGMRINNATNKTYWGIFMTTSGVGIIRDCDIRSQDIGVIFSTFGQTLINCSVHNCGAAAVYVNDNAQTPPVLIGNRFYANGDTGVYLNSNQNGLSTDRHMVVIGNIFDGNTGAGMRVDASSSNPGSLASALFWNNIFSNNTTYGINFNGSGMSATVMKAANFYMLNNNFYNNTTAKYTPGSLDSLGISIDEKAIDPQYVSASTGDFRIGTNLKAFGYPLADFPGGSIRSYVDIGSEQRQEPIAISPPGTFIRSIGTY